ncbi:helix-turn-helix domain-containing protein [Actinomadura rugatobispora]|uniref:Helix-turn-helix domain-containing protein n=1 Tax=Actinomadura rugatobispora TaxID=1994 RepID=A0ABW1A5S6_9ACTN|nr:hypothetical protein GCM10010200_005890 [Actinomadura rugatobispora]
MGRPSPQTDRLLDLVDLMVERPDEGLALAEIARALNVAKATVHPMVTTLTRRGWLLRHPERHTYRLGPALVAAGRAAARGHVVVDAARPVVREIVDETGLPCLVLVAGAIPGEYDDLLVGEIVQPSARHAREWAAGRPGTGYHCLRLGDRIPPRPPLGAVCVAWSDDPGAVGRWLDRLGEDRPPDALEQIAPGLASVRERGWALEVENRLHERLKTLARELGEDRRSEKHAATLHGMLGEIVRAFDLADTLPPTVEPGARYRPTSVNAPVFDASGAVTVALCMICSSGAPGDPAWSGTDVIELGERVRAAADAVTAATHGRPPESRRL